MGYAIAMSQSHLLGILQLFDSNGPVWTVEELAKALGISLRTAYRLVRELTQAGFLDPVAGAGYVLGPAFIRFDRIIRQSDPLIRIAGPGMTWLLQRTSQEAAVILCRRFRDCIICVHLVDGEAAHPAVSYERGVAMSMFLGAPAKVMLAFLPSRALRSIYLRHEDSIRAAGSDSWPAFKDTLRDIRKAGYAVTESEVGKGRLGIAAPIMRGDQVVAAISLVLDAASAQRTGNGHFPAEVMRTAAEVSKLLPAENALVARA
jgi:DNA-binding IclR family transcriptional regulator